MPRLPRLHVCGAFYHVTLRGNHRQPIFRQSADRACLNAIVRESMERSESRLHAYCWMTNHLHLLVQVSSAPLGQCIRRIASCYARWYQKQLDTTGHLFERRYHALLVDVDSYLLELIRYIHLNPVRAGLVSDPVEHPWSSHHNYLGTAVDPWVTTGFALSLFGGRTDVARSAYVRFIHEGMTSASGIVRPPCANAEDVRILGDDTFRLGLNTAAVPPRSRQTLDQLITVWCGRLGVTPEDLVAPGKVRVLARARAVIAFHAIRQGVAGLEAVARRLGRDTSSLRQCVEHHRRRDPSLFREGGPPDFTLKSPNPSTGTDQA